MAKQTVFFPREAERVGILLPALARRALLSENERLEGRRRQFGSEWERVGAEKSRLHQQQQMLQDKLDQYTPDARDRVRNMRSETAKLDLQIAALRKSADKLQNDLKMFTEQSRDLSEKLSSSKAEVQEKREQYSRLEVEIASLRASMQGEEAVRRRSVAERQEQAADALCNETARLQEVLSNLRLLMDSKWKDATDGGNCHPDEFDRLMTGCLLTGERQ